MTVMWSLHTILIKQKNTILERIHMLHLIP